MTLYEELVSVFRAMNKHRYVTQCEFAIEYIDKHNMSIETMRKWRKQGLDRTIERAFGYCKSCSVFFRKAQSHQVCCGSRQCCLDHTAYMSRHRGDNRNRPKPISIRGVSSRNAKRKVSAKRATNAGKRYTKTEIEIVRFSTKPTFELALSLGRSVSSIEGVITRLNKETL